MTAVTDADLKQHAFSLAHRFLAVLDPGADETARRRKRLQPYIDGLEHGFFRLVVAGEVKKGKSSFINGLLGLGDLLPVDVDVATSVVYKILYGSVEKFTVFFLDMDDESDTSTHESCRPITITRDQLSEYGTEGGNPGNEKNVDFIAIELPNPLLREGIVLIDTPGVGGLFKKHRDITFRYTPDANAVFFVVDSVEAPISDAETKFLDELKKATDQITFIQTKIDAADQEQREGWQQRNLDILTKLLGRPASQIPYFLVSSTLKSLADQHKDGECLNDSGFLAVIQFLRNVLLPRRDAILAKQLSQALIGELVEEGHSAEEQIGVAQESSKPKLAEYRKQLLDAEAQFEDWISEKWPKQLRLFQDQFGKLKRDASNQLQDFLSSDGNAFRDTLDHARSACTTPESVAELGEGLLADYAAECNQQARGILNQFVKGVHSACKGVLSSCADDLCKIKMPQIEFEVTQVRADDASRMDAFRMAMMNWSVFGRTTDKVAGAIGWTAAAVLLSNPVGWTVAAAAGLTAIATSIWSAVKGYKSVRQRQAGAALANLERAMITTSQRALRSSSRALQELAADLETKTRDGFDDFKSAFKSQFTKQKKELRDSETRTAAEVKEVIAALNARLKALMEIAQALQKIHGPQTA